MLRAFRDALRIPDLQRKIVFTLLLLALFRLGSAIPTPGVNGAALSQANSGGILGLLGMISGGNLLQFPIFALGVLPYITASIVIQLMTNTLPVLEKLSKDGEEGRKKINQYTRYAAIALGTVQAFFFAMLINNGGYTAVGWEPGLFTVLVIVLTQVAGVAFTMWIGERITEVGIGNGVSLIITAGIIASFPREIANTAQMVRTAPDENWLLRLLAFAGIILVTIVGIVYVYQAERRIPITHARARGGAAGQARSASKATWLPIKVNQAGVIPVIFASAMLMLPGVAAQFSADRFPAVAEWINTYMVFGQPAYLAFEAFLIFGFTYLYNSVQFDPKRIAEQLRESNGFIPGVRPGAPTAEFLGGISQRLSLWGAIFLVILTIMPQMVQSATNITTFQFSGTGFLIIVGVAIEFLKQLEAQLTVRRYEGFITKGRLRGRLNNN